MKLNRLSIFSLLLCFVFPLLSNANQLEDAKTAIEHEDFKKAYKLLSPLVEDNNAEAQRILGILYINGQGVETDATKGLSLIMKAAKQGNKAAKIHAFNLCSDLAKQGDVKAMYNVGYMCLKGWGGEQDTNNCIKWLETAAELGHANSASILSQIYSKGMYGISPDEKKAFEWKELPKTYADGINGKWTGTTPEEMGGRPMTYTYDFKADGNKLKGTHIGSEGQRTPIKDGKIDGNNISFTVDVKMNQMEFTLKYTGVLFGNFLRLDYIRDFGGPDGGESTPVSLVAKRVL